MALLVGNMFEHAAAVTPHAVAATLGDEALTFRELDEQANRVAHALQGRGIGHGDRVAWWGDTSLEVLALFAALAKLGAVFAPINARLAPTEAATIASCARPRLVIADDAHAELVGDWEHPVLTHRELFPGAEVASPDPPRTPALDERDAHVIFFTSGSTGQPKGVVISHRAHVLRSFATATADRTAATVCMFPLFHMAGWSMAMGAWQARQAIHLVATADAHSLLSAVERHRATRLYCIPAVWSRILEHDRSRYDLSSLREADTGTSATPPELVAAIREAFPHTVTRVFYGSTEAGPGTLLQHADLSRKPGSVGQAVPGVLLRVDDRGEVCLRSEFLMDGYFEQPEATRDALREGWYHTGDVGVLDDEGFLTIVGRVRDVVRTGGETVAPGEVEAVLADHPAVAEVAVVGLPDPRWGEVVCAVVVARPGATVDVAALRAHCSGRLARYKHPRRLEIVDALPRTPATGQVQRALLVEQLLGRARTPRRVG